MSYISDHEVTKIDLNHVLFNSIEMDDIENVIHLMDSEKSIDVFTNDDEGFTPLTFAVRYRRNLCACYLLKYYSYLSIDKNGNNALSIAIKYHNNTVFSYIFDKHPKMHIKYLMFSIKHGNRTVSRELLNYNMPKNRLRDKVEIGENKFHTPIYYSSKYNDIVSAFILCKYKVDLNAKEDNDDTALEIAIRNRNYWMTKLLLDNGAVLDKDKELILSKTSWYGEFISIVFNLDNVFVDTF